MTESETSFSPTELLYDTFHPMKVLGEGGMGRALKIRADRQAPGFPGFLAASIAWQEALAGAPEGTVVQAKQSTNQDLVHDLVTDEDDNLAVVVGGQRLQGLVDPLANLAQALATRDLYHLGRTDPLRVQFGPLRGNLLKRAAAPLPIVDVEQSLKGADL